ncbi:MAG: NAD(P)H-hydrate dehydratase [Filifactor alocis]|nr:NAD(P)H-hydrate dehydratase [Filifactor alocis]
MTITLTPEFIRTLIPIRQPSSHKGSYGRVLIVAGSPRFPGAPCLCARACMRSGSGLVTLAVEKEIFPIVAQKLDEAMVLDLQTYEMDFFQLLHSADCVAFGCGSGIRDYSRKKLSLLLNRISCPLVIDADGLNLLAERPSLLHTDKTLILTPHEGEFSRLTTTSIQDIKANKVELAEAFARNFGLILVLKGEISVITDGKTTYLSDVGVPEMATGGMGDALTGVIASFIGQKISPLEASALAVYLHSYTARELSRSMYSVLAGDVISRLPFTIRELMSNRS